MKKGLISQQELSRVEQGLSIEQLLLEKGLINEDELAAVQQQTRQPASQIIPGADPVTIEQKIDQKLAQKFDDEFPVKVGYGEKGFKLSSRDGNWATNIQWRAQMRYSNPHRSDPRQVSHFERNDESTFELRRVRMKIGGHGYKPWLKYYFEVDLQPTRNADGEPEDAGVRLIDWRATIDKFEWLAFRAGQWKINYNRERVDSSGRQTFVERSIVNRIFTIDRQMGVMAFGRLFAGTPGDMSYFIGAFNGEGRGVKNDDSDMMYMGRLQWNFLGRDLKWRQSDVEYTKEPTGSLAFAGATTIGKCTRWSSGGCGNLDGFSRVSDAQEGQFKVQQMMQEAAFKWRGFALQQEFHWKRVTDRVNKTESHLKGSYAQVGYFFHDLIPVVPEKLELAFRYAFVDEPNATNIALTNTREEFTGAINYFISGHNNKLTLDFSHLTLEDAFLAKNIADQRVRFQWDVSF
ncbi:MAG: OprO/OprP family phosphate-selective porin [Gammaproteobacteria bacterium]|nr:OprO/OprP family phosphate-selective porin [Gammaproteobacteria bacterium]